MFRTWLKRLKKQWCCLSRGTARPRRRQKLPCLETLEDRIVPATVELVKDIYDGPNPSTPENLVSINGTLFFTATDAAHGTELWRSDGTAQGTTLVKDIGVGPDSSDPQSLTAAGDLLYFTAVTPATGRELWVSDGTPDGTALVADIHPGSTSSAPSYLTNVNGTLFFNADDGQHGAELWRAQAGTASLVADLRPGSDTSYPYDLTDFNGTLVFAAITASDFELWKSDGTELGTQPLLNVAAGDPAYDGRLTVFNNALYFRGDDSVYGIEPWRLNGLNGGAMLVKDIAPGASSWSRPDSFTNVDGTLYFTADPTATGGDIGLWKTDPVAGAIRIQSDPQDGPFSFISNLTAVGSTLYFTAQADDGFKELWKTDTTSTTAELVKDINPVSFSNPSNLANVNGTLYFTANDGAPEDGGHGFQLWRTDGTDDSTVRLTDGFVPQGSEGGLVASITNLTLMDDILYFAGDDGTAGSELWKLDISTGSGQTRDRDLTLNQQTLGSVKDATALDRWNFTGVQGQQLAFTLVNKVGNVAFRLRGPNGWVGFDNDLGNAGPVTLPSDGSYTLEAFVPGGTGGAYAFRLSQVNAPVLVLNMPSSGRLIAGQTVQVYQVTVPEDAAVLQLHFDDATDTDGVQVFARHGALPTRADYDYGTTEPGADHDLVIPAPIPGVWYISVVGRNVPVASTFSLTATAPSLSLQASTPDRYAGNQTAELTITGAGFLPGTQAELIGSGGVSHAASAVKIPAFDRLIADFDLTGLPQGAYDVRVTSPHGAAATLAQVFQVLPAGSAHLETRLILPPDLGRSISATLYVEYSNTGTVAMPAPILVLQSADPDGSDRPKLTLDPNQLRNDLWTDGQPLGFTPAVQIYATGATPGLLEPGETIRVPVYYAGLQKPWDFTDTQIEFEVRTHEAGSTDPIDWAGLKASLRPDWVAADAWDGVFANLTAQIGPTWGDYVRMLSDNATYLNQFGLHVTDVNQLYDFELGQAIGFNPVSTLTSVVDASLPTPGLALSFGRSFDNSMLQRQAPGPFGVGWSTSWQTSLETLADGTVVVNESAVAHRIFLPDSRVANTYLNTAGDTGVLIRRADGSFELTESTGLVTRFRSDGKLDFVQDANGNRVTAGYVGSQLVSLTHSSGASLTLAYNAFGLIDRITDSAGRVTTYGYDLTHQFLVSVTGPQGTTLYTYDTSADPRRRDALTSMTDPSGVAQVFEYDSRGRLSATYFGDHIQPVQFTYDEAGTVTLTDAAGLRARLYYDSRGLIVRSDDALGGYINYEYDASFRLARATDSEGHSRSYTWCDCGQPKTITDELGNTVVYSLGGPLDKPTAMTDADGNVTRFGYDAQGNHTTSTYADGSVEQAVYNALGEPTTLVNRRGQTIALDYDTAGEVTRETFSDGSENTYTYDVRGRLSTAVDSQGTATFTYDQADRLTRVDYPDSRWLIYTYDAAGRRLRMEDSSGFAVDYTYDAVGRLHEMRRRGRPSSPAAHPLHL